MDLEGEGETQVWEVKARESKTSEKAFLFWALLSRNTFLEKLKESLRWDEERQEGCKVIFESGRSQPRVFYNNLFYAEIRWRKSALETNAQKK